MHRAASARLVHLSMGVMPAHCKWTAVAASTSPPLGPSSTAHAGVRHGARSHLPLHCLPALRRRQDAAERTASRQTAAFASNNGSSPEPSVLADEQPPQLIQDVDWSSDLANTITLIGNMGSDPELKTLPTGATCATFSLAYRPPPRMGGGAERPSEWHKIEIYNDLALEAASRLRKGQKIAVHGRLRIDQWTDRDSGLPKQRTKVVADQIATVRPYQDRQLGGAPGVTSFAGGPPPQPRYQPPDQPQALHYRDGAPVSSGGGITANGTVSAQPPKSKGHGPADIKWEKYFEDPSLWWDNRATKRNPKQPDFVHKTDRSFAVWLEGAPAWAVQQLKERGIADETSGLDGVPF